MTALAAARRPKEKLTVKGRRFAVAASTTIWQGAMVALKTTSGSTYAQPAATATGLTVVGVATATAANGAGAAGAISVDAEIGVYLMDNDANDPVTLADVGNTVYATDDHTIARTSATSTKSAAGVLFDVDATGAWVRFS